MKSPSSSPKDRRNRSTTRRAENRQDTAENHDVMLLAACLLEDRLPNSTDMIVMKSPRLPPEGFRNYEAQEQHFELLWRVGNVQCRPERGEFRQSNR